MSDYSESNRNEPVQKPKKRRVWLIILIVVAALVVVGVFAYNNVWRFYMADTYTGGIGGSSIWRIPSNDESVLKLDEEPAITINCLGKGVLTLAGEEHPFTTTLDNTVGGKAKRRYFSVHFAEDTPITIGFFEIFTGEHFEIELSSMKDISFEYVDDVRDRSYKEFWIVIPYEGRELGTYLWTEEFRDSYR